MIRTLAALALVLSGHVAAHAQPTPRELVRAPLLAESGFAPGATVMVAVRMEVRRGWHVYWRNPGDSGTPPEMAWRLPEGFSAGGTAWPVPARIPVGPMMNYGYAGTATLLVPITAPASISGTDVTLAGRLSYLACEEICVPGETDVSLVVPAGATQVPIPENAAAFAEARAALPVPSPWPSRTTPDGERIALRVDRPGTEGAVTEASFLPYADAAIDNAAPQEFSTDASGLRLSLAPADAKSPPASLAGVLTLVEGGRSLAYEIGGTAGPPGPQASLPARVPVPDDMTALAAAGLAFLGGLLLNLMPCVFPVLSIKVLSLVQQAGESRSRVRLHGLAYTVGALASFLALAGLLIALKAAGAGVGWGFQLQSPIVVAGLAAVMLAMALGLSGALEIGAGIAGLGDGLTRGGGYEASFFTGALATVVATPCTAPFMGTAVGFAATQPPATALLVFACLGTGLAFPFLALTAYPSAVRLLPRPGRWMDTLKRILAIPLYLTAAWLLWVLSQQVGTATLVIVAGGLLLCANLAAARARAKPATVLGAAALSVLLVAGLATLDTAPAADPSRGIEPFTQARLDTLRSEGRTVFVDMTAAWCITCQVNERGALSGERVRAAFRAGRVAYLRGDWTNRNPEITALLAGRGRDGVPLYLLYRGRSEPETLPQILTEGGVLAALAEPARVSGPSENR